MTWEYVWVHRQGIDDLEHGYFTITEAMGRDDHPRKREHEEMYVNY